MQISLKWLKEFVDVSVPPEKLAEELRSVGLNVESVSLGADDIILDIEITTNRPDCLNHYGVAREFAVTQRSCLNPLKISLDEANTSACDAISIKIADPDLCHRYCGRVIQNVRIGPSPKWLARRLESIGVRAINNVTDVTNYVLMELGHPLHAFDINRLTEKKIIVRRAHNGESLRTLDGQEKRLTRDSLVIADALQPVALAGIMGGEHTGISDETKSILLESAWFDPVSIRSTTKQQGLRSEASFRFERGADINMAPKAIDRAATLITKLAGGEILEGILDIYPTKQQRMRIPLTEKEILRVLGIQPERKEIERILRGLGFQLVAQSATSWQVTPPSFRPDIHGTIDLIEEVARHIGYDKLPSNLRLVPPRPVRDVTRELDLRLYERLTGLGYSEIINYPMVDPEENARFVGANQPPVPLENPLSQEASVMRSTAIPGMLHALKRNLDRDQRNLQFFEKGKTYVARINHEGLPNENWVLTLGLTGERPSLSVHEGPREIDFFDLKGDIESLVKIFSLPDSEWQGTTPSYYDQGQSACLVAGNETLVNCGKLNKAVQDRYKFRSSVQVAEINLGRLIALGLAPQCFKEFSRFPAVERDFSLTVPNGKSYGEITKAIKQTKISDILSIQPLDQFSGGEEKETYSLLIRVIFQNQERTFTSNEVAQFSKKILGALERISVRIRSN